MPVSIDFLDFKCFNQLRNGSDFSLNTSEFSPNLVGNVGEKVKVSYTINLQQSAFTEGVEEWFIINSVSFKQIERSSGSFLDDGLQVGDAFRFWADWENRRSGSTEYSGVVDFISTDGKRLQYSVTTGTDSTNGTVTNVGLSFLLSGAAGGQYGVNLNTAAFVKFGLIGEDESFNFLSKTTGAPQVYYVGQLVQGDPAKTAESLGFIKDWVSGNLDVTFITAQPDFEGAQYQVDHEFIINPFYILSYRQFIDAGTIPPLLEGDNSIKYASLIEFRKTLTDTGSSKKGVLENLPGFVGWFNENLNGLNNDYEVVSVAYEDIATTDPLDGININLGTKATITVSKLSGAITSYNAGVYLIRLPNSEDDYIGTETDLEENFMYLSGTLTHPTTSSGDVSSSLVSGDLVIEFDVTLTTAQKLRLTTDDEYLLLVQIEDESLDVGDSDRTMLIADLRNYVDVDYLADFIDVDNYKILQHGDELGVDAGQAAPILSNEDGILLDASIGTNTTRNVIINAISAKLVAYNSAGNTFFELDNYDFSIGDLLISGGVQQIEVDTIRGYPLPVGDDFNLVRITTGALDGDYRRYAINLGQKITWQEWINNPEVDNVFFNSAEPNNNLNEKASNYSNEEGYEIHLALVINVTGEDDLGRTLTGDYIHYGGVLSINDYGESDDGVTGVIETFDLETGNSLSGNILYNGKDTLFRAVFQNAASMQYAIHRIEISQNPGDGILELSSEVPNLSANLLKPLDGETALTFDLVGTELTTECLIDGSLIEEGVSYKLSARAAFNPLPSLDFKTALSSDGTNDYVAIDASLQGDSYTDDWTIAFWFKYYDNTVDSLGNGNVIFGDRSSGSVDILECRAFYDSADPANNSVIRMAYRVSSTVLKFIDSPNIPALFDENWHRVVFTRRESPADPNDFRWELYVDGAVQTFPIGGLPYFDVLKSEMPTVYGNLHQSLFGNQAALNIKCQLDQFQILESYVPSSDGSIEYNGGNGSTFLADNYTLKLEYQFDEADDDPNGNGGGNNNTAITAPELVDSSGNGYSGTLTNFTKNGSSSNWVDH